MLSGQESLNNNDMYWSIVAIVLCVFMLSFMFVVMCGLIWPRDEESGAY